VARLRLAVVITAAGVVDGRALTYLATEQLVEGLVANLAEQVPQGDVDG
jgi:hypothetical protein